MNENDQWQFYFNTLMKEFCTLSFTSTVNFPVFDKP